MLHFCFCVKFSDFVLNRVSNQAKTFPLLSDTEAIRANARILSSYWKYVAFKSKRKATQAQETEPLWKISYDCIQNYRAAVSWVIHKQFGLMLVTQHMPPQLNQLHVLGELWMSSRARMLYKCAFRLFSRNYLAMVRAKVFVLKHIKLQDFLWVKLHLILLYVDIRSCCTVLVLWISVIVPTAIAD